MTEKKIDNVLPPIADIINYYIRGFKIAIPLFDEIVYLYNKCIRYGIKPKNNIDRTFTDFADQFKHFCKEKEIDGKNENRIIELQNSLKLLRECWFEQFVGSFTPKIFFEEKVDNIISDLKKCESCSQEGFRSNAQAEIDRFEYFKQQLSYKIDVTKEIVPFPTVTPIFPYNLANDIEKQYLDFFNDATSKSQDLADQFQEFKDLWFLIRSFSLYFEISRVDAEILESEDNRPGKSGYMYRIQYLAELLARENNS